MKNTFWAGDERFVSGAKSSPIASQRANHIALATRDVPRHG